MLATGRYFWLLFSLLTLFCLRVLGQILVAFFGVTFLPPMEEWFSGVLPYPELLTAQILIIFFYGKICLDFARGHGYFVTPGRRMGIFLLKFGSLYLSVMIIRYVIRMSLYPHERWTGGSIPIFFHWVLSSFLLVLGTYHWTRTRDSAPAATPRTKASNWAQGILAVIGVLMWAVYLLTPSILAYHLGMRRSQFAVRDESAVMRTSDGTQLMAEIYHPHNIARTPTILVRIPLSKSLKNSLFASNIGRMWAERGYTVVIQGTRGRLGSGGTFYPLRGERQDGIETLAWIAKQPWFNGQIATWGGSAFGYTEWAIADQANPGPSALIIYLASTDFHGMFYPGGAFSLYSALSWAGRSYGLQDLPDFPKAEAVKQAANGFPLADADRRMAGKPIPFFQDWVNHKDRDAYWIDIDGTDRTASLNGPVLLMAGWYDPFLPTQLNDFVEIRHSASALVAQRSRLIIGPWTHANEVVFPNGEPGPGFRLHTLRISIPWFDENFQPAIAQPLHEAPVSIFVMGKNEWRTEKEWPLSRAVPTTFYLQSNGHANNANGDGSLITVAPTGNESDDAYLYDPTNPVPSAGGALIGKAAGIARQNAIEERNDVLVYTTATLESDIEVTGPVNLVLWVTTSAKNTDFTAKLVDVHPDGSAYNISEGIRRHTYLPGTASEIGIQLWPTSMVFFKGHRVRLEVSSSNFPRFDRNPNTNRDLATETRPISANQAVHHSLEHPSRLILPVVPAK